MEQVIAELMQEARRRGDQGTTEVHRHIIGQFLEALQVYVTSAYIASAPTAELRTLYENWVTRSLEEGAAPDPSVLGAKIHIVAYLDRRVKTTAAGSNVRSLF